MEGLIGFLVFLAIAVISGMSKSQKPQRPGSRPQWPGPVAGGPGMPSFPRVPGPPPASPTAPTQQSQEMPQSAPQEQQPAQPQRPLSPPQWPQPQLPPRPPQRPLQPVGRYPPQFPRSQAPTPQQPSQTPASVQGEGLAGREGPAPGDNVFAEIRRFEQTLDRDINVTGDVPVEEDLNVNRTLRPMELQTLGLRTSLAQELEPTAAVDTPPAEVGDRATVGLDEMIAARGNLAQAVVLAEILGGPKSLRAGFRRR